MLRKLALAGFLGALLSVASFFGTALPLSHSSTPKAEAACFPGQFSCNPFVFVPQPFFVPQPVFVPQPFFVPQPVFIPQPIFVLQPILVRQLIVVFRQMTNPRP